MASLTPTLEYGANFKNEATEFRLWAPQAPSVSVELNAARIDSSRHPVRHPMTRQGEDFVLSLPARPGDSYSYIVNGGDPRPDPVSRLLPAGVHGPTQIVDPASFQWTDAHWRGRDLLDYVIYELHIGTFTPQGTLDSAIDKLHYLKDLGITAIELMPVAAFPGDRNWGYDGVSLYAVHATYGGPEALRRFVNTAHSIGLAVLLDVVYNHFGPEGNYLRDFGPYFTQTHRTPWGDAINYDQPGSEGVRRFVIENALYWIREYHLDGLRLDAIQTIGDDSPRHIVAEISDAVHQLGAGRGCKLTVIAETDENHAGYLRPSAQGGFELDAVWSDDFHHALHSYLTSERQGYYQDFGDVKQIARALTEGFVFQGEHFRFLGSPRGTPPDGVPLFRHIICIQNHDQVGNRAKSERLGNLMPLGARKLSAALLLLAPQTPLLWMGQEYDEAAPFQFFTDYGDPALQLAVTEGRRREFKDFSWNDVPDPQDPQTCNRSKLRWNLDVKPHRDMLAWYRSLLKLRHEFLARHDRTCSVTLSGNTIAMQIPAHNHVLIVYAGFLNSASSDPAHPGPEWQPALSSSEDGFTVEVFTRSSAAAAHEGN